MARKMRSFFLKPQSSSLKRFTEAKFQNPKPPSSTNPHSQSRGFPPRGRLRIPRPCSHNLSPFIGWRFSCWARQATKPKNQEASPGPRTLLAKQEGESEANHCPHPQPPGRYDSDCPSVYHEPSWLPFSGIVEL